MWVKDSIAKRESRKKSKTESAGRAPAGGVGRVQSEPGRQSAPRGRGLPAGRGQGQDLRQGATSQIASSAPGIRYDFPICPACTKRHPGPCRMGSGGCFRCGRTGHWAMECPYPPGNSGSSRSIASPVPAPMSSSVRPPVGRGFGGSSSASQTRVPPPAGRGQARVFALTPQDVQASNTVVAGTLLIESLYARALFDPGATHSFISRQFASRLDKQIEKLEVPLVVATPVGQVYSTDIFVRACAVRVGSDDYPANLILLDMLEFDVILGMDWLSECYATVDCRSKTVTFAIPGKPIHVYQGDRGELPGYFLSALQADKLLHKGYDCFIAYIRRAGGTNSSVDQVPMVRDFPDVFPEELPGIPPEREIEFYIELAPGT